MKFTEKLFIKIEEDIPYGKALLLTLELNKIEARYQLNSRGRVFSRKYDDLGMVKSFKINMKYVYLLQQIEEIMKKMEREYEKQLSDVADLVMDDPSMLEMMIISNLMEAKLEKASGKNPGKGKEITHFFDKKYDNNGFPTHYSAVDSEN